MLSGKIGSVFQFCQCDIRVSDAFSLRTSCGSCRPAAEVIVRNRLEDTTRVLLDNALLSSQNTQEDWRVSMLILQRGYTCFM